MTFTETRLKGAYIIDMEPLEDERGFFARTWCAREFEEHGLNPRLAQCSISYNKKKGTIRGMHYQAAPHEEAKLVRCIKGAIYDVIIDLRPDSPTFRQWFAVELTAHRSPLTAHDSEVTAHRSLLAAHRMLYIPEGFAHGIQTLVDDTEVFYQISEPYHPELARGVRWDDPVFGIKWPEATVILSDKDRGYPDFR